MIAIAIFLLLLVYLAVAIFATTAIVRWTRKKGLSLSARRLFGWAAALVFFLIPFWDWIPAVIVHRYYCATEAKFEVIKSIDQWKAENPDAVGKLQPISPPQFTKNGEYTRMLFNQRLAIESKGLVKIFPAIRRTEERIIDMKGGQVLAHYVDFIAGYGAFGGGGEGAWKFWLDMGACRGRAGYRTELGDYQQELTRKLEGRGP